MRHCNKTKQMEGKNPNQDCGGSFLVGVGRHCGSALELIPAVTI